MCAFPVPNAGFYQSLLSLQTSLAELLTRGITENDFLDFKESVEEVLSSYSLSENQYESNGEVAELITTLCDAVDNILITLNVEKLNAIRAARQKRFSAIEYVDVRPLDVLIYETFHSILLNCSKSSALKGADRKDRHFQVMLSALMLLECIERSRGIEGIALEDEQTVTVKNCPANYRELVDAILCVKDAVNSLSGKDNDELVRYLQGKGSNQENVTALGDLLKEIAKTLNQNQPFLNIMKSVQGSLPTIV